MFAIDVIIPYTQAGTWHSAFSFARPKINLAGFGSRFEVLCGVLPVYFRQDDGKLQRFFCGDVGEQIFLLLPAAGAAAALCNKKNKSIISVKAVLPCSENYDGGGPVF